MDLSAAIRLGAMMKPQGFGQMFFDGRTCALGAALDAVGIRPENQGRYVLATARWPILVELKDIRCPLCGFKSPQLDSGITHLNDCHDWTREQIADWVETIESSQSVDAVREPSDRTVSPVRV